MSIIRSIGACGLLTLLSGAALNAQQYTFQSFEVPTQGKSTTFTAGMNSRGEVAGYFQYSDHDLPYYRGFRRYSDGKFEEPIAVPGADLGDTWAKSVNDSHEIGGYYAGADGQYHGFLDNAGVFTTFDAEGGPSTFIQTVDDAGDFAGFFGDFPLAQNHGFISKGGIVTQIDVPGTPDSTEIWGMDGTGAVAGCANGFGQPFFRTADGKFVQFAIAHENFGCATGIRSELGLVAGFFNDGKRLLGFVLDYRSPGSQPDPLTGAVKVTPILYPGSSQTQVWGMNALGQLSGLAYLDGKYIGFIATPTAAPTN